jgi:hypothetical protein
MSRGKWFHRLIEPVDVVRQIRPRPPTGTEPRFGEPPFAVVLAGYVVDFHHRNACFRCRPDGSCTRLADAGATLRAWRELRARRDRDRR